MLRLVPGRWLNSQLRLLSWLGEDLHGEGFLAELRPQGRMVHVKVLRSDECRKAAYLERFRRTAERAMTLIHRHAVTVHAFGVLPVEPEEAPAKGPQRDPRSPSSPRLPAMPAPPGIPWIATDPAEGPDLTSYLVDGISPGALAELLRPIADLLDRAADMGLEHGELSPGNLIIVQDDQNKALQRALLLDLGVAKMTAEDPLEIPLPPGTLNYRSPEQCASGLRADAASDRYALATILFEGVAGRTPFGIGTAEEVLRAHRSSPLPPLQTLAPGLHRAQALDAFFVRALAKEPEARFSTATAVIEEFILALGVPKGADNRLRQRRRSPRWYRLRRVGSATGAVDIVDIVIGPRAALGKQPECDVVCHGMPSPDFDVITAGISREHAVLIRLDDRLSVLDQSVNGTYVNERRAGPRLTPVHDGSLLRMGEHLTLQVTLLGPAGRQDEAEVVGALLERKDRYAAGVPPTMMLWHRTPLHGSPMEALGGPMQLGAMWVAQRELWWSGHSRVAWRRQDGTVVAGPAPLRSGDTLSEPSGTVTVDH